MKPCQYGIAFLLAVLMSLYMIPVALAEDNASVLQSIGHEDTDTVTLNGTARTVTLTVPFPYAGSEVDLSNGLNINYDEGLYKYVVAEPYMAATVDGAAVSLVITYNGIDDEEGVTKSETEYTVRVVRAAKEAPEFSGTIKKTSKCNSTISFYVSDFSSLYDQNDGDDLGFITITGSNMSEGTLQFADSAYIFGSYIADNQLESFSFVTASSGTVSYNVTAYSSSDLDNPVGTAVLTITVSAITAPTIDSTITRSTYSGSFLSFPLTAFTNCCDLNGGTPSSVEITPVDTTNGSWYVGRNPFTSTTVVAYSDIDSLYFSTSTVGTATFKWRIANEAGYSAYGTGSITVSSVNLILTSYTAPAEILKGKTHPISSADFEYSPTLTFLRYVKISTIPASTDGYLCLTTSIAKSDTYGYPALTADKALAVGAIIPAAYIDYLSLVTKSTSNNSSISFTWTATTDSIASKATWATAAGYTVNFVDAGSISYDTDLNLPITFDAADFSTEFEDRTGYALSYITFTLPSADNGILYYNYDTTTLKGTTVAAGAKYYRSGTPELSKITFVPVTGYTGTVTTTYNAYSADGTHATGTLEIVIANKPGGTLIYTTDKNTPIYLDAKDFKAAFQSASGASLSYVKFTLPSSAYGKLYYNDQYSTDDQESVSSGDKYYVYDSPYLSYISFVPHNDYTGNVDISFTAYTSSGTAYKGKLKITVIDSPAGIVMYSTNANSPVTIDGDDFTDEFINVTGSVLSYINFTAIKADSGVLYYNYSAATGKGTAVSGSTKYYCGSDPDISDLTFVPASGYSGTVTILYTAYTPTGTAYVGKLKITLEEASAGLLTYTTHINSAVNLDGDSFSSDFLENTETTLAYVKFILPSASYGTLYYSDTNYSDLTVAAETKFYHKSAPYLSGITFVPYTDYIGQVTIPYIAYNSEGTAYTGEIIITIDDTQSFSDVGASYSWASEAIEYLYRENVINGTGNDQFSPQNNVLRGDFILMLCRALDLNSSSSANFADVAQGSYYYNAIASAKALGIVTGNGNKFSPDVAISRQDAMVILARALSVTSDNITPGDSSDLAAFSDRNQVADYAVVATATLVKAGLVTGSNGSLNPNGKITRAEMAVIMYRILNR